MSVTKIISETAQDLTGKTYMKVQLVWEDGTMEYKNLDMASYLRILGDNTQQEIEMADIGRIPDGYLTGALSPEEGTFRVAVYKKPAKRGICYFGMPMVVPFPGMVFYFAVEKRTIKTARVFCVGKGGLDGKAYYYPFGNVSMDHRICFGNVRAGQYKMLSDIEGRVEDFFMSETNDDYYDQFKVNVPWSQGVLLQELKKKKKFPISWLKPIENMGVQCTVQDVIQKF